MRLTYRRVERFAPPEPEVLDALAVDAPLALCLEQLGAPWQVLEQEGEMRERGLVLIYAWERASGWAGSVSSGQRNIPGSFSLGRSAAGWSSVVLWFDVDDRLERWQQGSLPPELASVLTRRRGF